MTLKIRHTVVALLALSVGCARDAAVDLEKVPVGTQVALTRQDGGVVQGAMTNRDKATVQVDVGRGTRTVPREQIADVQLVTPAAAVVLPPAARFREYTLPEGQPLSVRLETAVSSKTGRVEDTVEGTLMEAVTIDGTVVVPEGSKLRGDITAVEKSGKVKGRATLALRFRALTVAGHDAPYEIEVGLNRQAASGKDKDAVTITAPAAAGAIIGGILGGKKGALTGVAIGGGAGTAVVLTTAGPDVELPAGTMLKMTLDRPVEIRVPVVK